MADLVKDDPDSPLGGADASVIALAERLEATIVITPDRRRSGVIGPRHREAFERLP